jgi:hypothetical protein
MLQLGSRSLRSGPRSFTVLAASHVEHQRIVNPCAFSWAGSVIRNTSLAPCWQGTSAAQSTGSTGQMAAPGPIRDAWFCQGMLELEHHAVHRSCLAPVLNLGCCPCRSAPAAITSHLSSSHGAAIRRGPGTNCTEPTHARFSGQCTRLQSSACLSGSCGPSCACAGGSAESTSEQPEQQLSVCCQCKLACRWVLVICACSD